MPGLSPLQLKLVLLTLLLQGVIEGLKVTFPSGL